MAHLTCIGHTKEQLNELLDDYSRNGVHDILALAGDPPADGSPADRRLHLRARAGRAGSQPGRPLHRRRRRSPRAPSPLDRTGRATAATWPRKLDAADMGISQFFFDAGDYFRMVDELAALGCDTPVHPGVMPMTNPPGVRRMTAMAGATFPEELAARVEAASDDQDRHTIVRRGDSGAQPANCSTEARRGFTCTG
ncbi:MAG: methylenetetrahydrofolate reductase [Microthrixaceae bacterium]